MAASCPLSIFAAQLLLALGVAVYVARLVRRDTRLDRIALDSPLLAFAVWSLLSASFAPEPVTAFRAAKQLVLLTLVYLGTDTLADPRGRERVLSGFLMGGLSLSGLMVLQYHVLGLDTLAARPHGFLGHYMTASGLVMATLAVAAARLALSPPVAPQPRDFRLLGGILGGLLVLAAVQRAGLVTIEGERLFVAVLLAVTAGLAVREGPWPGASTLSALALAALPLAGWALLVSRTRNAWVGAAVGLALVLFLRAPRTLVLLPLAAVAVIALRPRPVIDRLTVSDASSVDRYYMWQAGLEMVRDRPVFGQGPGMVPRAYQQYRWLEAPNPSIPHLHDNTLQIAAERGLPCVVWWLWWMAAALSDGWRELRAGEGGQRWAGGAAVAALGALMSAGLFEYNLGDSEVLMFTLLASSLPYALRRQRART